MAKLHFYYSAMNAGKSTTLLQSSYNYNERGMDTILLTPLIDTRYGAGKIGSRLGLTANAAAFSPEMDLLNYVKQALCKNNNIKCVLVDEAQFLTKKQVHELCQICDFLNLPVLAYGIRTDFRAEPFEGSLYLLAWADILTELKTICHCGRKAIMNTRIDAMGNPVHEGAQTEVGGNERYMSLCRRHFELGQTKSNITQATQKVVDTLEA